MQLYCFIHFIQRFSKTLAFPLRISSRKIQLVMYTDTSKSTAVNYKKMSRFFEFLRICLHESSRLCSFDLAKVNDLRQEWWFLPRYEVLEWGHFFVAWCNLQVLSLIADPYILSSSSSHYETTWGLGICLSYISGLYQLKQRKQKLTSPSNIVSVGPLAQL